MIKVVKLSQKMLGSWLVVLGVWGLVLKSAGPLSPLVLGSGGESWAGLVPVIWITCGVCVFLLPPRHRFVGGRAALGTALLLRILGYPWQPWPGAIFFAVALLSSISSSELRGDTRKMPVPSSEGSLREP